MIPGYVLFRLGSQTFALHLDEVREIVRLEGLEVLPGTPARMAGVIVLRGNPLPVLDVRALGSGSVGDVLVMEREGEPVGAAVDQVLAVLAADDLPEAVDAPTRNLPAYVIGVRRNGGKPVLLVDLQKMLDVCAGGWSEAISAVGESHPASA